MLVNLMSIWKFTKREQSLWKLHFAVLMKWSCDQFNFVQTLCLICEVWMEGKLRFILFELNFCFSLPVSSTFLVYFSFCFVDVSFHYVKKSEKSLYFSQYFALPSFFSQGRFCVCICVKCNSIQEQEQEFVTFIVFILIFCLFEWVFVFEL